MGKTSYSFGVLLGSLLAYIACGSDYAGVVDITGALLANFAANCTAYADCYVSSVMDVQRGISLPAT